MKKFNWKKIDLDRLILRLFILSIAAAVILSSAMFISWFFGIDIQSTHLWIGALILLLSFSSIYVTPIPWKILIIFVSIIVISIFLFSIFGWSIELSSMVSLAIVIFMLSAYISI